MMRGCVDNDRTIDIKIEIGPGPGMGTRDVGIQYWE